MCYKDYSGLKNKEIDELDSLVKRNTLEKVGPVRNVKIEIVFEGIYASSRHNSGQALRFPKILRWSKDKSAKAANSKSD
jgi:DNA ligase-1